MNDRGIQNENGNASFLSYSVSTPVAVTSESCVANSGPTYE
jgi:hypothetical protein